MANTLRFKRGLASGIPTALAGEPLFTTDTFDLYIGNGTTNTRFQKYIASGTTSQLLRGDGSLLTMPIVLTSPANGQVLKYNGTSWVNDSDAGITGSGSAGQVAYFTGATTQGGSNNLFWDNTNSRLGVGTNIPAYKAHIKGGNASTLKLDNDGSRYVQLMFEINNTANTGADLLLDSTAGTFNIRTLATYPLVFQTAQSAGGALERARIFATGNFGINTGATDSGQRLQVIGTGYISDNVQLGGALSIGTNVFTAGVLRNYATIPVFALQNPTTGSGASDGFQLSASGSLAYIWQYENSAMLFGTNATERMRLDASGNLGLGVTPSAWGDSANGTRAIQFSGGSIGGYRTSNLNITQNAFFDGTNWVYNNTSTATLYQATAGQHRWFNAPSGTAGNAITFTQAMTLDASGNLLVGSTTSSGERLQVTGTAKITQNLQVGVTAGNTGVMQLQITGTSPVSNRLLFGTDGTGYQFAIGKNQAGTITNLVFLQDNGNFGINTAPSERLHVAGNMLISGANSFKMRNLAGTDVNVIRAVTGGTNTLSTATLGNHIAIGTQSGHDFLLCSNDTERIRISNQGWFSHTTATNPSSSVTDSYVQYSADITAGNAAPHFRTENGAVIKLYQETTAVGNSIISLGGGNAVLDDTTFDGYTLRQIVKALRNQGILA